jgi:hypothetical protein
MGHVACMEHTTIIHIVLVEPSTESGQTLRREAIINLNDII